MSMPSTALLMRRGCGGSCSLVTIAAVSVFTVTFLVMLG
jgi:hypothetical protein